MHRLLVCAFIQSIQKTNKLILASVVDFRENLNSPSQWRMGELSLVAIEQNRPFSYHNIMLTRSKSSLVTRLEWLRGFQEVMVHRFHDNDTGWW